MTEPGTLFVCATPIGNLGDVTQRVLDTLREADVIEAERREGDPPVLVADPSRITEALGWQPQHSSLEPIIESAWKWETR